MMQKYSKKVGGVNRLESVSVIQGLYDLDPEGTNYSNLLAKVELATFREQNKEVT